MFNDFLIGMWNYIVWVINAYLIQDVDLYIVEAFVKLY